MNEPTEIRRLLVTDFDRWMDIAVNAYPGIKIDSDKKRTRFKERLLKVHEEEPTVNFYGLFRDGQLLGGMRFHDFTMNFLGIRLPACGVGMVAVDLLHKKEHVAKEMLEYYLRYYQEREVPLAMLYPFRPDFYKKMGFGYGTQMSQYRLTPDALPGGTSKAHLRYLSAEDKQAIRECYTRVVWQTHGMIEKSDYEITRLVESDQYRLVGYEAGGQIRGYLAFAFEHGESFIVNDIHIRELIYETRDALSELLAFLNTQYDQIRRIIIDTQDDTFYFLLLDPRNEADELIPSVYHESNVQGVGLMYRVLDIPQMFARLEAHNFAGQTCRLKLTIADSFLPENAGSTYLHFEEGHVHVADAGTYDVEIQMDIAEFSSMLVGAVSFERLYRYGLAEMSDPVYMSTVNRLFAVADKPMCTTAF